MCEVITLYSIHRIGSTLHNNKGTTGVKSTTYSVQNRTDIKKYRKNSEEAKREEEDRNGPLETKTHQSMATRERGDKEERGSRAHNRYIGEKYNTSYPSK
jgi:hypothetical protein